MADYTDINKLIAKTEEYNNQKFSDHAGQFVRSRFLAASQDEGGDSVSRRLVLSVGRSDTLSSIRRIGRILGFRMVGSRCSCSHDCCGHWFGDEATITRYPTKEGYIVIIEEGFSRNV